MVTHLNKNIISPKSFNTGEYHNFTIKVNNKVKSFRGLVFIKGQERSTIVECKINHKSGGNLTVTGCYGEINAKCPDLMQFIK